MSPAVPNSAFFSSADTAFAERETRLVAWLNTLNHPALDSLIAAEQMTLCAEIPDEGTSGRVFRVLGPDAKTVLAYDMPNGIARLARANAALAATGVSVPTILAHTENFALSEDPGSIPYSHLLNHDTATKLHLDAIEALVLLQARGAPDSLPAYARSDLLQELMLFPQWFIGKHIGVTLDERQTATLNKVFDALLAAICAQAQVIVHGDYTPANLIVTHRGNPAMLGYQDARFGPITYDIVSLLRDPSVEWDEEIMLDWAIRYWERAKRAGLAVAPDIDRFYLDVEYTSVQRHLTQLGRAARRFHRDGRDDLLAHMPTLMASLRKTAFRYRELVPLVRLLEEFEDKQPQVGFTF